MKAHVRALLRAVPFQPFLIRLSDGREHRIHDPELVLASPNDRSWVLVEEPDDNRLHQLSPALIVSVDPLPAA